jgi:hypothetical protein
MYYIQRLIKFCGAFAVVLCLGNGLFSSAGAGAGNVPKQGDQQRPLGGAGSFHRFNDLKSMDRVCEALQLRINELRELLACGDTVLKDKRAEIQEEFGKLRQDISGDNNIIGGDRKQQEKVAKLLEKCIGAEAGLSMINAELGALVDSRSSNDASNTEKTKKLDKDYNDYLVSLAARQNKTSNTSFWVYTGIYCCTLIVAGAWFNRQEKPLPAAVAIFFAACPIFYKYAQSLRLLR